MKKSKKEFPFDQARTVSEKEVEAARKAIEAKLGTRRAPRRGRPKKGLEKFEPISIRLHPKILAWAKKEAKKQKIGYQTVINQVLLEMVA